jgi:hypothetical protein
MLHTLDTKYNSIAYTARFESPLLELWGSGAIIAKGIYEAYLPFGVPLSNLQLGGPASNAADPVVTVKLGDVGVMKFAFDRTESSFVNFTEATLQQIPKLLLASTEWIRTSVPSFKIASHHFLYSNHSLLEQASVTDFLTRLNPRTFKSGQSIANGVIFNLSRPETGWYSQLMLDRSLSVKDGLFLSFGITLRSDKIDYSAFFIDARRHVDSTLEELSLRLSNSSR